MKKGIKQYDKINAILLLAWFLIIALAYLFLDIWWIALIVYIAACFAYMQISKKMKYKYVISILYEDLDGKKYYNEVINKAKGNVDVASSVSANYFAGNYKNLEGILENELTSVRGDQSNVFVSYLKFTYFDTNNVEKLKEVCENYDVGDAIVSKGFFNHYVNGEYNLCLVKCDEIEDRLKSLQNKNKKLSITFEMLRVNFMRAVTYYRLGEFGIAKALFQEIMNIAPNLQYADISASYLKAIETGDDQYISSDVLFVDRCEVRKSSTKKRSRPLLVALVWIVLVGVLILTVGGFLINDSTDKSSDTNMDDINLVYNIELRDYLSDAFEEWEIIGDFYLEKESLFVVKSENSLNIVGYVFDFVGDEVTYIDFKVYAKDIEFDKFYENSMLYDGMTVKFMITDTYYHISPETLFVNEIEIDGELCYFSIAGVRTYEERYAEAFDYMMRGEFEEYTVCGKYYSKDENLQSDIYVIQADDALHIVGFYFKLDDMDKAEYGISLYQENAEFDKKYSSKVFGYASKLSFLITEARESITEEFFSVNEIIVGDKIYYFAVGSDTAQ